MFASSPGSASHKVIVAGGGVAALEAVLCLRALAEERVDIVVIAPEKVFRYRPTAVLEPFGGPGEAEFDLPDLLHERGGRYQQDALVSVDPGTRRIWTAGGVALSYDSLLIATGAIQRSGVPGALTYRGRSDTARFLELLAEMRRGVVRELVFAFGGGWVLPLYELAILTHGHVASLASDLRISVVSPEKTPLAIFGRDGSETIAGMLADREISFIGETYPVAQRNGHLRVIPEREIPADAVVTLPRLEGPAIPGLPHDESGFIPIDGHCAVHSMEGIFAAGDATAFPVKQGGIACQMADVAAASIASRAGALVTAQTFEPVLRGLLLTDGPPAYLRNDLVGGRGDGQSKQSAALWWPPAKIAGHYLAPYLALHAGERKETAGSRGRQEISRA